MKKALILGILGSFFFAFTFLLNRNMNLTGGSWIWSTSLRYLFTFPILAFIIWRTSGFSHIHTIIKKNPFRWLLWSTVGFGFFYVPITYAGVYSEAWLIAASWQVTIVMGVLLTPLFKHRIPIKNLLMSGIILIGVFLLQAQNIIHMELHTTFWTLIPILVAATCYPLGNRKMMALAGDQITTTERIYGMTLCSLPFWLLLSTYGFITIGSPSASQSFQAFCVSIFAGIIATLLFFKATDLVKSDPKKLAVIESTQSGEVIFTLIGGTLLLGDSLPDTVGMIGILLILLGMILSSLLSGK